jgi:hypothetical protein
MSSFPLPRPMFPRSITSTSIPGPSESPRMPPFPSPTIISPSPGPPTFNLHPYPDSVASLHSHGVVFSPSVPHSVHSSSPSSPNTPVPFPSTSNAISLSSTFKDILQIAVEKCEHQAKKSLSTYSFDSELRECGALDDLVHIFRTCTEPLVVLSRSGDHSFFNRMVILLLLFLPNPMLTFINFWFECSFLRYWCIGMYLLYFLQSTCDDLA